MKAFRAWGRRLAGVFASTRAERELSAELQSHLELHIDDNIRAGMTPAEARRHALMALGGLEQTKEPYRDRRGLPRLQSLARDLRFGLRTLRKTPGFALAGVVILGLGIGVNSAMFTVVNAVVLRPLPFADADRVMRLWQTPPPTLFAGTSIFPLSPANFIDWEATNETFERMAIYRTSRLTLTGRGQPDAVIALRGSADFLPILGLSPIAGRGFTGDDDRRGGPMTVVLSEPFFRSRFGGDSAVIGTTMLLDGVAYSIIGVVPSAPVFIDRVQIYVPLAWSPEDRLVRNNHNYRAIGQLRPGVPVERAQADLTVISKRLEAQYPADNKDWGALVRPLQADMIGGVRQPLLVLLGAVALVLLIACANLANLMLVRTHARAREIALRGALGGSRRRIVQLLVAEGLVLGIGGGLAGLAAAYYGVEALKVVLATTLPRVGEIAVDGRVLVFTATVSLATGLVAAFVPAWRLSGRDVNEALRAGAARGHSSAGDGRVRNLLVISEVALALMLLVGAGLLVRTLSGLRAVDPGFDPENVLTATLSIPSSKYSTPELRNQFFDRVQQGISELPGVTEAASVDSLPLQGGSSQYVHAEGMPLVQESELPVVAVRLPSPGYFRAARIPLLEGRDFTVADSYGKPRVVIVSDQTAQRFWPGQSPLGKRLTLTMMTKEPAAVVGVVREIKLGALDAAEADSETAVYAPAAQFAYDDRTLVMRTDGDPRALTRSVVAAVQTVDPEQPVLDIATLSDVVEESLGQRPLAAILLAGFALLALMLASVGLYSVLAFLVRQRVREIGIRMALGAPVGGVLRLVIVEGLKPTLMGVALGLTLAAALGGVMTTMLYGVSARDPRTFGMVTVVMLAVAALATLLPAYRAAHVDPIVTLRAD